MTNLHDLFNMGNIPELRDRQSSALRRLDDAFRDVSAALTHANVEESLKLEVHTAELEFVAALTAKVQSQQDVAIADIEKTLVEKYAPLFARRLFITSLISIALGAAAGIAGVESVHYAYHYGFASRWIPTCTKIAGGKHCEFFVPDDSPAPVAQPAKPIQQGKR
jgi:hypothetical protein